MSEKYKNPETKPKYGANVIIHNFWQRHSQKQSAEVFNTAKTGLSSSSLSEAGVERAVNLGETITASTHGAKGYRSASPRTMETFEAMMEGYKAVNPGVPLRESVRFKEELVAAEGNKDFFSLYDQKWNINKQTLLREGVSSGKYPDVEFSKLSPDQQEEIAEAAEEPVMRDWTDNPESELARIYPPRKQAAKFARLFNRRHERMAEKLLSDSEIDLFHITHKSVTEPFLTSGVLIRKSDGQRINSLQQLGGSLKILDNWESEIKTDIEGRPSKIVKFRGDEFVIDDTVLKELLETTN